jgi:hypothetical protein
MPVPKPNIADSDTIIVRVPMVFRRRGGRKALTTPDGSPAFTSVRHSAENAIVKAVARAFRWRKLIETGVYDSIGEIAAVEKINSSYVGRILRLSLLAPDLVEAILDRQHASSFSLGSLMQPLPSDWPSQRRRLSEDPLPPEDRSS